MLKIRQWLLYSYILLIPFDNFHFLPVSMSNMAIILLFFIYFAQGFKLRIKKENHKFVFCFIAILMVLTFNNLINVTLDSNNLFKVKGVVFHVFTLLFLIFALDERNNISLNSFLKVILFSVFISVSFGYYEYLIFYFRREFAFSNPVITMSGIRIKGMYFDPNYFAVVSNIGVIIAYDYFKKNKIRYLATIFFLVATMLTQSRMGVLAILLYVIIRCGLKSKIKAIYYFFISMISYLGFNLVYDRLINRNIASTNMRIDLIYGSVDEILKKPFFGYGYGYLVDIGAYVLESHNTYLQILLDGGVILFLITLVPLIIALFKIILSYRRNSNLDLTNSRFIVVCLGITLLFQIFFLSYFYIKYFWLVYYLIIKYMNEYTEAY